MMYKIKRTVFFSIVIQLFLFCFTDFWFEDKNCLNDISWINYDCDIS